METRLFAQAPRDTDGVNSGANPAFTSYQQDLARRVQEMRERPRSQPRASFVSLSHDTIAPIASRVELVAIFFVYGVVAAVLALITYAFLTGFGDVVRAVGMFLILGVYFVLIGLIVHPWMRKHLNDRS